MRESKGLFLEVHVTQLGIYEWGPILRIQLLPFTVAAALAGVYLIDLFPIRVLQFIFFRVLPDWVSVCLWLQTTDCVVKSTGVPCYNNAAAVFFLLIRNTTTAAIIASAPIVTPTPMPAFAPILRDELLPRSIFEVAVGKVGDTEFVLETVPAGFVLAAVFVSVKDVVVDGLNSTIFNL